MSCKTFSPDDCLESDDSIITPEDIYQDLPLIMSKLGISKCRKGDTWIRPFPYIKKYSVDVEIGCDQIEVISKTYLESTHIVQCILTSACNTIDTWAHTEQFVRVTLGEGAIMKCHNVFNIKQRSSINLLQQAVVMEPGFQRKIVDSILDKMRDMVIVLETHTVSNKQKSGEKLSELIEIIDKGLVDNKIQNIVTTVLNKATASQFIDIELSKNDYVSAANCFVTQDVVLRLVTQSIIGKSFDILFEQPGLVPFLKTGPLAIPVDDGPKKILFTACAAMTACAVILYASIVLSTYPTLEHTKTVRIIAIFPVTLLIYIWGLGLFCKYRAIPAVRIHSTT